jgi:mono/diheme cytochrome c family protein
MRLLTLIGALAIGAAIGAAIFFFGGFYSVAATQDDPGFVAWALANVRTASIVRHAGDRPPDTLGDLATAQAGARAFLARGCVNCHGAPGVGWAKFSEGLRPWPADLKEMASARSAAQLFWVIKNGVKMTGMPSFGATGTPDAEIWTIVGFIEKLPTLSEADFKAWTTAP